MLELLVNYQFRSYTLIWFEFLFCCGAYSYEVIWHSAYIPPFTVLLVRTLQQVPMFGKSALQFSFQLLVWYYLHSSLEICRFVSNILFNQAILASSFVDFWIKWLAVPYFTPVICLPPLFVKAVFWCFKFFCC